MMSDLSQVAVYSDSSDIYKVSEDDEMMMVGSEDGVVGKVTDLRHLARAWSELALQTGPYLRSIVIGVFPLQMTLILHSKPCGPGTLLCH